MRVLWITNDLPPRAGGIQQFVDNLIRRVDPTSALVIGPADRQGTGHDPEAPYEVVRHQRGIWPTPGVLRMVRRHGATHRPDVVVLGASWPLGELARHLRSDPGVPVVGLTHGLEAALAGAGLGGLIRRATRDLAAVTTISDWTELRLTPHVRSPRMERVPPGVDVDRFHPAVPGRDMRRRWGIPPDALLVGCISRLVRRKGQDRLLDAWPSVAAAIPDAWLAIVGTGPLEDRLRARASRMERVVVTGEVPWADLPASYAALDVFTMPCRTRLAGLDVEGLGIVYLEAQATGVPVVAGRSGGAPEAVQDGRTGHVVDGDDAGAVAEAVVQLLESSSTRSRFAAAGRAWTEQAWSWEAIAGRFRRLLGEVAGAG